MMVGLWLAAWFVDHLPPPSGPDRFAWVVVLVIQSIPYVSSLLASLASAFPLPACLLGTGYRTTGVPQRRTRRAEADSPS